MYYFSMNSRDIRINLATEEYLLNKWDKQEPLMLFYIQEPSIILGKNQDYEAELNLPYVRQHHITVTRRLSGGGAVYDDLGNLSFSIVTQGSRFGNFKELTQPIVTALRNLGAEAEMTGRNDLVVASKKFSGNAMYQKGNKLFCHGTLMYDVDLSVLAKALRGSPEKLKAHRVRSVSSRVTNLKDYLAPSYHSLTTAEFRDLLICQLFQVNDLHAITQQAYQLAPADKTAILALVNERYGNQEWVQGRTRNQRYARKQRFDLGTIEVRFNLRDNRLSEVNFYGDFFSQADVLDLEQLLEDTPFDRQRITAELEQQPLAPYFGQLSPAALAGLFFKGGH